MNVVFNRILLILFCIVMLTGCYDLIPGTSYIAYRENPYKEQSEHVDIFYDQNYRGAENSYIELGNLEVVGYIGADTTVLLQVMIDRAKELGADAVIRVSSREEEKEARSLLSRGISNKDDYTETYKALILEGTVIVFKPNKKEQ
ncbi:hypothetical protein V6R21_06560 [Limibacter armeniacum]|uniref:hypothetical protein n=1 Tax=Limibacter armeniacum TaxID=466084 RepID=UPI002FE59EB8